MGFAPPVAAQKIRLNEEEQAWIQANPIVRVAADRNWMPIEYMEDGEIKGLAGELLAFIEQNTGLRFVAVPSSDWSSVAGLLERREVDMVSSLVRDFAQPSFAALVSETRTYYIGNTFIFALEDNSMIFDVKQLEGRVVAVKGGGEYEAKVRALYPGITILATRTPEDSLIAVIEGRADAAMGVGQTMLPYLRRKYGGLLQVSGGIASLPVELTMGVRRDLVILHGIIDKALASISAERAYEMEERSFDYAAYGAPTLRVMFSYYGPIFGMIAISLLLILFFALHARKERREAIRSESEKKMFIAVLTHEIRTPMNAIIASIELLGRGEELSSESRRLLDLARSGSENLLYLLNDVLDVSKLEAGRLQLNPTPTDFMRLIGSVVDLLAVKAREQGLTLELIQASGVQQWLMLDKVRMEQILQNLISNAIKFTAVGGVTVMVRMNTEASSPRMGELQIHVIDTGIGIDPHSLEKLFQPYTQALSSESHRPGGTGLGLLICRQLCELMGGSISLSSEAGKGTVATVVVPCELHEPPAFNTAQTVSEAGEFQVRRVEQPLQVLLVEDTPANQIVLQAQLEVLGCHSMLAPTGSDALAALEQNRFDIVLLDCQLPDISGYELARRWRQAEVIRGVAPTPIVAVSAQNDATHTIACFDAGMNGVLGKPIKLGKLRDTLVVWAGMHVAEAFEESLSIGTLQTAADSLQIDVEGLGTAIENHDQEGALYCAHRLLGACAVLGYPRMILCLKDLQSHLLVQNFEDAGSDFIKLRRLLAEKKAI
ncbi:ATP-binding protein [Pseudomonas mosselii]|uniref:ATP-binding protein n=1 Tax=Pseudomonas mosselii TaxID=78327 RepID=UPI002DB80E17|nr:ATP-binding protein [Pseudomonas mosselii]MEB5932416.1 ATP-binding protein [Pseudomonas mosselii]